MGDDLEIHESADTESAAAEALADVATEAIDATAERVEALVRATTEIQGFRTDLETLRAEFRAHVESNQVDFVGINERLTALGQSMAVMEEALHAEADAVETLLREEIRGEMEAEAAEEMAEAIADDVADVVAAETEEAAVEIPPPLEPENPPTSGHHSKRSFVRI